jgi:hypothetical protein
MIKPGTFLACHARKRQTIVVAFSSIKGEGNDDSQNGDLQANFAVMTKDGPEARTRIRFSRPQSGSFGVPGLSPVRTAFARFSRQHR